MSRQDDSTSVKSENCDTETKIFSGKDLIDSSMYVSKSSGGAERGYVLRWAIASREEPRTEKGLRP